MLRPIVRAERLTGIYYNTAIQICCACLCAFALALGVENPEPRYGLTTAMESTNPSQSNLGRTAAPTLIKHQQRLEDALSVVAPLVAGNIGYIPIYERLEEEIANTQRQFDVIRRAQKMSG